MAKTLNFTFEIFEVQDNTYGVQLENGQWNGVIGGSLITWLECWLQLEQFSVTEIWSRSKYLRFDNKLQSSKSDRLHASFYASWNCKFYCRSSTYYSII